MKGRVFAIEEFSTFDGPGIRTTVFLKGCPLSCSWCHNPEGQSPQAEYLRSPNGCLGCGACERAGRREAGRWILTQDSVSACPKGLVRLSGEEFTADELVGKLLKNAPILCPSGGVTFSGGEPLMQADFLQDCLQLLQDKLHCAVQTCGFASASVFDRVLSVCDFVLYDLKVMDGNGHKRYCGVENGQILANYHTLITSGVPFITRVPLIPGVIDTEENLTAIASFVSGLGVDKIELLPYNKLAGSKYASVMRTYRPDFDPDKPSCPHLEIFDRYGVKADVL